MMIKVRIYVYVSSGTHDDGQFCREKELRSGEMQSIPLLSDQKTSEV